MACYTATCIAAVCEYLREKRTRHKIASAEHIQMLKEKTDSLSVKNKFIATITHEIRNFVSNIVTNASFLKESGVWSAEVVNELAQASSFLAEILNNTLDISKLDEGKIEFNNSYESLRSVIDVVLSISKANADKKGIKLDVDYCSDLPDLLEFDKSRLTQIIMNLVGNAVKFTTERGKVTVRVGWAANSDSEANNGKACRTAERLSIPDIAPFPLAPDVDEYVSPLDSNRNLSKPSAELLEERKEPECQDQGDSEGKKRAEEKERLDFNGLAERRRAMTQPDQDEKSPASVPDEESPIEHNETEGPKTERIRPRKIACKVMSHSFVAKSHIRSLTGMIAPSVNPTGEDPVPNVTFETMSRGEAAATPLATTPDCVSDSTRMSKMLVSDRGAHTKKMSTFCLMPKTKSGTREEPEEPEEQDQNSGCNTTKAARPNINYALMKLRKVAKEFRMSQKYFPREERCGSLLSPAPTKGKRRTSSRKRPATKSYSLCESPNSAKKSPAKEEVTEGKLTIEVVDTGCGMSLSEQEKLFQPFSQGNKSVQSHFGGTGLGLWLCSKLISAMHGSITCTSVPKVGTTFKISLTVKSKSESNDSPVPRIVANEIDGTGPDDGDIQRVHSAVLPEETGGS